MKKRVFQAALMVMVILATYFLVSPTFAADRDYPVYGGEKKRLRDMGDTFSAEVVSEGRYSNFSALMDSAASADSWRVLVDLSDTTNYAHNNTTGIIAQGINMVAGISAAAWWQYILFVVTDIDGTSATLRPFEAVYVISAGTDRQHKQWEYPGAGLKTLLVTAADIDNPAITTSTDLASPAGTTQAEVGDIIVQLDEVSGSADFSGFVGLYYYTY